MSGAIGIIIALTALALTTLFGLAFLLGGILIGTLTFLGYVLGGMVGAALFCAAGAAMVMSSARSVSTKQKPTAAHDATPQNSSDETD